jgi:catechol 2,3-dioxygenase-like lactoylglutathione lyase family enzyme
MAVIKVRELAYVRLGSPDLGIQEEFLTDFGMTRVLRTAKTLYMRGTDPTQYVHVTELGDPAFLALGWQANSDDDLKILSKLPGASGIEHIDAPGGGIRVRLKEPNGYTIEVVHGIDAPGPIAVPNRAVNSGPEPLNRAGTLMRIPRGPSAVKRIAHGVLFTPLFRETLHWFRAVLGLLSSDDMYAGSKDNIIGSFNRCDRGDEFVDHHAFFCMKNDKAGLNHVSFEVHDIDDVFVGHEYLVAKQKYNPVWGIGRHVLGSQVYDYWADPWGRVHEHWADSDRLNASHTSSVCAVEEGLQSQWGEAPPASFVAHVSA